MLIAAVVIGLLTLALMLMCNVVVTGLSINNYVLRLAVQHVVVWGAAAVIFHLSIVSLSIALSMAAIPPLVNGLVIALGKIQRRRALSGAYGQEVKWAAELSEEDESFEQAVMHLPRSDMMEIGIIADSKEELREQTLERFRQYDDGTIEEFVG